MITKMRTTPKSKSTSKSASTSTIKPDPDTTKSKSASAPASTPTIKPDPDGHTIPAEKPTPTNDSKLVVLTPSTKKSLHRISLHPTLTPYRRWVYRVLLSVPPGRWTTYSALATYLGSSARAVGNAMRANPFAPEVPCHRVLAADGRLGGYKGEWKNAGKNVSEKRRILQQEGVVFDDGGRVKGTCFGEFVDLGRVK